MDFLTFSLMTGSTDQTLYNSLYSSITNIIKENIGDVFKLTTITTPEKIYGENMKFVLTGFWQSFTEVKYHDNILILDEDYITEQIDSQNPLPLIGITLKNMILKKGDYITITGIKGFADTIPYDVDQFIFQYLKAGLNLNNQIVQGTTNLKALKNHSSEEVFDTSTITEEQKLFIDPFGTKIGKNLLKRYKLIKHTNT